MQKRLTLENILIIALGTTIAIGMIGAFVGLDTNSLWADELFTFWVVGNDNSALAALARAQSDVHPPVYYMLAFAVTEVFGRTAVVLRALSAFLGVAAVAAFYYATRTVYSVPARLVGMTVAVSSGFWISQTQNARSYGLGLLVGTVILGIALDIVDRERERREVGLPLAVLAATMVLGTSVHFYMQFVALAVLAAMFVLCPRLRWRLAAIGVSIVGLVFAYLQLVVRPHSVFSVDHSWIKGDAGWYRIEVWRSTQASLAGTTMVSIALLCLAAAVAVAVRDRHRPHPLTIDGRYLCVAVPPLVLLAGIASSVMLSPNFTSRNLLLCSPFLWGAMAFLYDAGAARLGISRAAVFVAVGVLALLSVGRIESRYVPTRTPLRESAQWIDSQPGCRGKSVAYFINHVQNMLPGEAERHGAYEYGYYLRDIALVPVYLEDAVAGRAIVAPTCRVIGWGAHYVQDLVAAEAARAGLQKSLRREVTFQTIPVPGNSNGRGAAFVFLAAYPATHP